MISFFESIVQVENESRSDNLKWGIIQCTAQDNLKRYNKNAMSKIKE